jgi:hypothetical protein
VRFHLFPWYPDVPAILPALGLPEAVAIADFSWITILLVATRSVRSVWHHPRGIELLVDGCIGWGVMVLLGLRKLEVGPDSEAGGRHGENCECNAREPEATFEHVQQRVAIGPACRDACALADHRRHHGLRGIVSTPLYPHALSSYVHANRRHQLTSSMQDRNQVLYRA